MTEGHGPPTTSLCPYTTLFQSDATDTVTVSQAYNNDIQWSGGTIDPLVGAALVAGFSVDKDRWDYSSIQNLDFLADGETITFSFDVVATDDSGTATDTSAPTTV